jgi:RNA polymerase sigma-70 factor, ECF subfamily
MFPEATDRVLALRVTHGDAEAFGELVRRHQSAVFNVAYRLVGNRRDAEDMTQDVFIRAFRAFHTFDLERPLRPWLKQIATNTCLNWLESLRVRPETVAADLGQPDDETASLEEWQAASWQQDTPTPEQALSAEETAGQLRAAILRLPPRYRAVIELRHFQELNYEQIAAALGRPLSDVKSDLFRARKLLAQSLNHMLP